MNRIWTAAEDSKLKEGIAKYGYKWQKIKAFMNHTRSINSLVKRWHYKVKYYDSSVKPKYQNSDKKQQVQAELKVQDEGLEQLGHGESNKSQRKIKYEWKKNWTDRQDKKLKILVIQSGLLNWIQIAQTLQTTVQEARMRWRHIIYPTITKQGFKVGGSLKWSFAEDKILNFGYKQDISWEDQGRFFLPIRTLGSVEARWRRVQKNFEAKQNFQNRHLQLRQCLRKIAKKQRQARQNQNKED